MQYVLPRAEWCNDAMRPGLVTFLRRLDKVFMKISKKPSIRVKKFNSKIMYMPFQKLSFNNLAQHRLGSGCWIAERSS